MIGLDEGSSSARISRYETGEHEPPYATAQNLAEALQVPVAYLYCDDDELAEMILLLGKADETLMSQVRILVAEVNDS